MEEVHLAAAEEIYELCCETEEMTNFYDRYDSYEGASKLKLSERDRKVREFMRDVLNVPLHLRPDIFALCVTSWRYESADDMMTAIKEVMNGSQIV